MSKDKGTDRVIKKRSVHYKNIISGLSYITNSEAIIISTISAESDYDAPFLVNISVERKKGRLTVPALLDIRYQLNVETDY